MRNLDLWVVLCCFWLAEILQFFMYLQILLVFLSIPVLLENLKGIAFHLTKFTPCLLRWRLGPQGSGHRTRRRDGSLRWGPLSTAPTPSPSTMPAKRSTPSPTTSHRLTRMIASFTPVCNIAWQCIPLRWWGLSG